MNANRCVSINRIDVMVAMNMILFVVGRDMYCSVNITSKFNVTKTGIKIRAATFDLQISKCHDHALLGKVQKLN